MNNNKLVLGQKKVDSKSNEITAILAWLDSIDIAVNIITIDAMGTQKEIAKQIINRKADYILALKGNQSKLHQQVKEWFEKAKNNEFFEIEYNYDKEVESGRTIYLFLLKYPL